MENVTLT